MSLYFLLVVDIPSSAIVQYTQRQRCLSEVGSKNVLSSIKEPTTLKYRFDLQRVIGMTVGGLSLNSGEMLIDKIVTLKRLIGGQKVKVLGKTVVTTEHEAAPIYCSNLLAVKLVVCGLLVYLVH